MHLALGMVAMAITILVATSAADRIHVPAPLLLIAAGILGSYLPFVPEVRLTSEVVLVGLLPPLLYSTAIRTSVVEFNANRRAIGLLSVGLVAFTTIGIGVLLHALLPGIPWYAAVAAGAVVAPPDAVAATAVSRTIGLPRRVVTVLEGESLLNDATALVALRTALAATVAWHVVVGGFLLAAGGGLVVGVLVYLIVGGVRRSIGDPVVDSGLSFVTPFAAYVGAEALHVGDLHGSGVIAVVVAGLLLGHRAPVLQTAQSRITERLNWRTIGFVLEGAVFLLIGLQARGIFASLFDERGPSLGRVAVVCVSTLAGVIVLRLLWVFPARFLLVRPEQDRAQVPRGETLLIGWAGMRGVVTLAAAFVIPEHTPFREELVLLAFFVTAGTLFVQGLSLPVLARRLHVRPPDPAADALARANLLHVASQAGLDVLEEIERTEGEDPHEVRMALRRRLESRDNTAWERVAATPESTPSELYARHRRRMLEAERRKVLEVRSTGQVPHEVVQDVLAMLDVEESLIDQTDNEHDRVRDDVRPHRQDSCQDLAEALEHEEPEPHTPGQCDRCLEEGTHWVQLRECLECGVVACCDSSSSKHATVHYQESGHPVMRSAEPGESWRWCFRHDLIG